MQKPQNGAFCLCIHTIHYICFNGKPVKEAARQIKSNNSDNTGIGNFHIDAYCRSS